MLIANFVLLAAMNVPMVKVFVKILNAARRPDARWYHDLDGWYFLADGHLFRPDLGRGVRWIRLRVAQNGYPTAPSFLAFCWAVPCHVRAMVLSDASAWGLLLPASDPTSVMIASGLLIAAVPALFANVHRQSTS
jgi:hypothetical protein